MAATQLAFLMLALPVLTAVLCRQFWKRPPTKRRALTATLMSLLLFLFPPHMCDAGTPTMQLLIGVICVAFVSTCATDLRLATALGVVMGVVTLGMALRYDHLVHDERFIGRRGDAAGARRNRSASLQYARESLGSEPQWASPPVEAGWLSDDPRVTATFKKTLQGWREAGSPYWHSLFTHLYARRRIPMEIWYPGGPVESGVRGMDWRDR